MGPVAVAPGGGLRLFQGRQRGFGAAGGQQLAQLITQIDQLGQIPPMAAFERQRELLS